MSSETGESIIKRHIIRYGIAPDQKYLVGDFLTTYDQLVINAAMVAHISGALTSFIMQRTRYKPFFIDPQTHAFQHDISHLQSSSLNSKGKIKKSIKSLLESYGGPVRHVVTNEGRLIIPEDFNDKRVSEGFCERVIDFQLEALAKQTESADFRCISPHTCKIRVMGRIPLFERKLFFLYSLATPFNFLKKKWT